jgi:hypothetical protein
VPEFVTVKICVLLTMPTPVVEKLNDDGCVRADPAAPPAPLNPTTAGFANAVEPALNVPVTIPFAVGMNTTPLAQLAPAARLVPQVFCTRLNGAPTETVSPPAVTALVFVMVAVCAALACPRVACVKNICAGLIDIPETACPIPLSGT